MECNGGTATVEVVTAPPPASPLGSAAEFGILAGSATRFLRARVPVFRANPSMRIGIGGFTGRPGTAPYNMAPGLRCAEFWVQLTQTSLLPGN